MEPLFNPGLLKGLYFRSGAFAETLGTSLWKLRGDAFVSTCDCDIASYMDAMRVGG